MHAKWIEIKGLRGFASVCRIDLAVPTGHSGSGLTILVGPNNSGKSTVVEALNALSKWPNIRPSFAEGKRNARAQKRVEIRICNEQGATRTLRTVESGGSETDWISESAEPAISQIFVLPSRRTFNPFFSRNELDRASYIMHYGLPPIRGQSMDHFSGRLFQVLRRRHDFNRVLSRVLDPLPDWTIELSDSQQYYLKFRFDGEEHNSDGAGEGLVSLFFIVDALYDSDPGSMIVIDEPELSLHPSLQKRLIRVIADYAEDRQVLVATHSPYFVDWDSILAGARIVRLVKEQKGIEAHQLESGSIQKLKALLANRNNPHILGLNAKEVFFLQDNIILVEGQDDVMYYGLIAQQLDVPLCGEFFGWGVGGAGNMGAIASILRDLGFRRVAGILDKGQEEVCRALSGEFPDYRFFVIPAADVRSKAATPAKDAVVGILDQDGRVREEYRAEIARILQEINTTFRGC